MGEIFENIFVSPVNRLNLNEMVFSVLTKSVD